MAGFQIERDDPAREWDEQQSPEHLAEIGALVASSRQMASDALRRADA